MTGTWAFRKPGAEQTHLIISRYSLALFCVLPMFFQKILHTMVLCVTAVVFSGCLILVLFFFFKYNILQPTQCLMHTREYNDMFQTSWVSWHGGSERAEVCFQLEQPVSSTDITGPHRSTSERFPVPYSQGCAISQSPD